jgi:hypothetical protein
MEAPALEAADCLTVWARYAYRFTSGWEREIPDLREYERWLTASAGSRSPLQFLRDDSAVSFEQNFNAVGQKCTSV